MKVQPEYKMEDVTATSSVGFWLLSWVAVLSLPPHICCPFILENICSFNVPWRSLFCVC